MTDQPKRKSALSRPSQRDIGARSIEQFVARANEELSAIATARTLEAREDELRREVDQLQARHADEVEQLRAQLARRRTVGRLMVLGAFVLGAGAMFAIDLARAPSRAATGRQPPQAAIDTPVPPPTSTAPPSATTRPPPPPPPAPEVVTAPPATETVPPATATTPPAAVVAPPAPPVASRPPRKPPARPRISPSTPPPQEPRPPPPPPPAEDLVNPF